MTQSYSLTIRAGNSGTTVNPLGLQIRLLAGTPPAPVDLDGAVFVFRVYARGQEVLRKDSDTGNITVDLLTALVTVPLSVAENRTIEASGPALAYDLERWQAGGMQRTVLHGTILIEPGVNDD